MKRLRLRDTALFTAVFSQREAVEVLLKELIGRKDLVIEEITPTFIEEHFISPDYTCVSVACKNENFEDVKVGFYLTLNTDVVPLANSFRDNYYLDLIESKCYARKQPNETI